MTYKPTEKELDEAMKGMECWQTMEHIKKCVSCQQEFMEFYMKIANDENAEFVADCEGE